MSERTSDNERGCSRTGATTADTPTFAQVVTQRHSARAFTGESVAPQVIRAVLEDAQLAPSNCNTQPWQVHIVSGHTRNRLAVEFIRANNAGELSPDFTFDMNHYYGVFGDRARAQGKTYNDMLNIDRDDVDARRAKRERNIGFHGAPHVAFLFMPVFGDGVRGAGDVGMYAQTFLLSLVAHGLAGVPQTVVGFYADIVRRELGVRDEFKLLFGMSFGIEDKSAEENRFHLGRAPLSESVFMHDTPGVL